MHRHNIIGVLDREIRRQLFHRGENLFDLIASADVLETPLTRRIARFSRLLMVVVLGLAALTFVAIAGLRLPLIWVLALLGGGSGLWAYRRLNTTAPKQTES